jgi:hypothetical protein
MKKVSGIELDTQNETIYLFIKSEVMIMGITVAEKTVEATAEVFITALKAMSIEVRERIYEHLVQDPDLMEDLLDIALIENRRDEPSRSFDEFVKEIK